MKETVCMIADVITMIIVCVTTFLCIVRLIKAIPKAGRDQEFISAVTVLMVLFFAIAMICLIDRVVNKIPLIQI